jgi:hypothetical protein
MGYDGAVWVQFDQNNGQLWRSVNMVIPSNFFTVRNVLTI